MLKDTVAKLVKKEYNKRKQTDLSQKGECNVKQRTDGFLPKRAGEITLFDDINEWEKDQIFCCLTPEYKNYLAGESIIDYHSHPEKIGVLRKGSAQVVTSDAEGNTFILEELGENSVFGELFLLPLSDRSYTAEALTDCSVMFIRYSDIIKRCEKACSYHSQFVDNLFCLAAIKARNLNTHLQILSQRNTRDKLLCYFSFLGCEREKAFELPMTWSRLADYLCVNRSALMREIKKLNEEKILTTNGKTVCLLAEETPIVTQRPARYQK